MKPGRHDIMFENLTDKLQRVFKNLRGQGKLTDEHLDAALAGIREALLDGDVNVGVADELLAHIRAKAVGRRSDAAALARSAGAQDRARRAAGAAGQARQAAVCVAAAFGVDDRRACKAPARPPPPASWPSGSPGTGTGRWWFRPTCIVRRRASNWRRWPRPPAWRCWPATGTDKPLEIVRGAVREAKLSASDVVLVDTAGRLHIDDELMAELGHLKKELQPAEILFIADAMIGQDAVRSAGEFHRRLGLTGVVLTKLDGDARGGAALSIGKVTGRAGEIRRRGRKVRRAGSVLSRSASFRACWAWATC